MRNLDYRFVPLLVLSPTNLNGLDEYIGDNTSKGAVLKSVILFSEQYFLMKYM